MLNWPTLASTFELLIANPFQNGMRLTFSPTRMSGSLRRTLSVLRQPYVLGALTPHKLPSATARADKLAAPIRVATSPRSRDNRAGQIRLFLARRVSGRAPE
jgi:hypothetical protein